MAQSRCFSPVRGRAMRVTKLDGCGRPVYGEESVGVSDGFVSISFTANTEEGDEISVQNAAGNTCVREVPAPAFLGYGIEIEFCSVDPALLAILTGQEPEYDEAGYAVGFRVNSDVKSAESGFAVEVWTGVPGVACDDSATASADAVPGGYLLLPYLQGGVFGDFTVENDAISFTVTGAATKTGSGWGTGPYDVIRTGGNAAPLDKPIEKGDHLVVRYTDVAPPPVFCGTAPLLDPDDTLLASVAASVVGPLATFTATPANSEPWYVEFGDGTWDYAADGTVITHTYAAVGTYTATAYRGSSSQTTTAAVASLTALRAPNGKTAPTTEA